MKRVYRSSVFLGVVMWLLFALLSGCALMSKDESKPDKTVIIPPQEAPYKAPSSGKGIRENGSSAKAPAVPPVTEETKTAVTYYTHTVKWSGESLSIIAGWYTGDIQDWKLLVEANPDMDPNVVSIGQTIRIPENIMKTKNPMTKAHVDSFYHKTEKKKTQSAPSEKNDEEPTLFGPKSHPRK